MRDLRAQLLVIAADLLAAVEGRTPSNAYSVRIEHNGTLIQLTGEAVFPALTEDEREILRSLANASEPLMSRGIARAVGVDSDSSTLRERLSPRGTLRAGGYMTHTREEGYAITDRGRMAIDEGEASS